MAQQTMFTVSVAACNNIIQFPNAFIASYQHATSDAWNVANPSVPILAGDIVLGPNDVTTSCASSSAGRHRGLLQSGTVAVIANIYTPPNTTSAIANSAASAFQAIVTQAYSNNQPFATNYGILAITSTVQQPTSIIYDASATLPPTSHLPPPPLTAGSATGVPPVRSQVMSSPSDSGTSAAWLLCGLGVGLGVAVAAVIALGVFFVIRGRRSKAVSPSGSPSDADPSVVYVS